MSARLRDGGARDSERKYAPHKRRKNKTDNIIIFKLENGYNNDWFQFCMLLQPSTSLTISGNPFNGEILGYLEIWYILDLEPIGTSKAGEQHLRFACAGRSSDQV